MSLQKTTASPRDFILILNDSSSALFCERINLALYRFFFLVIFLSRRDRSTSAESYCLTCIKTHYNYQHTAKKNVMYFAVEYFMFYAKLRIFSESFQAG
jgi:hypothetical protein